jgi:hypothetical protein
VSGDTAERYLRLGLQLDRNVEGVVDSYFGPPELAEEIKAAPPADPRELVAEAESLLDELEDGWLSDQVLGLRTFAGVLAGEQIAYADEVERCYGVRPQFTDEAVFAAAHEELGALLPGPGPLPQRFEEWRKSTEVPVDQVEQTVAGLIEAGRGWTSERVALPEGEDVVLEAVRDKAWLAYCRYLGDYRSLISVNLDLPYSAFETAQLTFHETYPGHHAEACLKDELLVRERGLLEATIVLLPTAQSLIAEGIATLAPELVLESGDVGLSGVDLEHALAVERARRPLATVTLNAALLLYESGEEPAAVQAYIERWSLGTAEQAAHAIRFLQDPTSRSYVITYSAGRELARAYVNGDTERFRRLLSEQVRARELLDARR